MPLNDGDKPDKVLVGGDLPSGFRRRKRTMHMKKWVTKRGSIIYQVLSGRCNVFLITNGRKHLLVDTGRVNKRETLFKELEKLAVSDYSLTGLILTHTHFDHAENAASVKEKYKMPIIIHRAEGEYLAKGENPEICGTLLITKLALEIFGSRLLPGFKYQPAMFDYLVDNNYGLRNFGFNGFIMHTPGHSAGSTSIIIDDEIALVGDAMFGVFAGSVFPPFANDPAMITHSWKKLLDTGCSIFLPSHGTGNSRELLQKQYDKYKNRYHK